MARFETIIDTAPGNGPGHDPERLYSERRRWQEVRDETRRAENRSLFDSVWERLTGPFRRG